MTILSACFSTLLCTFLPLLLENRRGQAHRSAMSDDVSSVRIRPGRIRDRGRGARPRAQSFMSQVLRAAAKANRGRRPRPSCAGPAAAVARRARDAAPALGAARRSPTRSSARQQRDEGPGSAGSSSRLVSSATNSAQALPGHIFATSSGTAPTRDGGRGELYGRDTDHADRSAFVERGDEDRHSFRFIVAPEDGDRLADLRGFTRDVMSQMEADLGTKLDWVAVDHFNTGHPHSHVVIRGKDDLGKDLIIAQDYITDGVRLRAQERATLELGPETDLELRQKLQAEVGAERFTRIDRAMIEEAAGSPLDLRPDAGQVRADFDRTLRIGRLQTLERYGLAREGEPGVWTLSERLEPAMRELGERGDIIKAMHRALERRGEERAVGSFVIGSGTESEPVVGRLISKRLIDELGDRIGLVIDGVDGRVHHVEIGDIEIAKEARIGSIVQAGRKPDLRPADRAIAELSQGLGEYRPSTHRKLIDFGGVHLPQGADADAFVDSHVRRLEALRRAGIVERLGADRWLIPEDFEQRTLAYDAQRDRQANMKILSSCDLDRQVTSDGATWLDRQLISRNRIARARVGFGEEVTKALEARTDELIRQGHASRTPDGVVRARADLLDTLQRNELERTGAELAKEYNLPFHMAEAGEQVRGKFTGTLQLASGKFAMIENAFEFQLVPWRPVIDEHLGREITGVILDDGGIEWKIGRTLGLGL
jgi:type IV secretory pathway VirD2 relaxase